MIISLIAAMDRNHVIGFQNRLPWHLPADLKHFKKLTLGKVIIMGRKTYESIGKALPGRRNIVISRNIHFIAPQCEVYPSLDQALSALHLEQEVFIIGGEMIFKQALALADRLYITLIDHEFEGDTTFPKWDEDQWQTISEQKHIPDQNNPYSYSFITKKKRQ